MHKNSVINGKLPQISLQIEKLPIVGRNFILSLIFFLRYRKFQTQRHNFWIGIDYRGRRWKGIAIYYATKVSLNINLCFNEQKLIF